MRFSRWVLRFAGIALASWLVVGTGLWILSGPTGGAVLGTSIGLVFGAGLFLWWASARLNPQSSGWPILIGIHALTALLFGSLMVAVTYSLEAAASGLTLREAAGQARFLGGEFVFWIWLYGVMGAGSFGLRVRETLRLDRERIDRSEADLARARLEVLRGQLNPHFLFNALHSVTGLVGEDPERATEALEMLGDLLRYSMDEGQAATVDFDDELRFTTTYLGLVDLAMGDRARVTIDLGAGAAGDIADLGGRLPPFALQTLVENAVRHGVEPHPDGGSVTVRVRRSGAEGLDIVVDNDRLAPPGPARSGRGLANLRARLEALYGPAATLEAGPHGDGFRAHLVVPS